MWVHGWMRMIEMMDGWVDGWFSRGINEWVGK